MKFENELYLSQKFTVLAQKVCVYPIHVSTRLFDVTLIFKYRKLYDLYCIILQCPDLKKKKKKKKAIYRPSQY